MMTRILQFIKSTNDGSGIFGFKPGLRFKMLFLIISVSIVAVIVTIFLLFSSYRQHLIDNSQFTAAALGNTIEASLHYAMLVNDWTLVDEIVSSIVQGKTVESIRIFDNQGVVIVSSISEEVGTHINFDDKRCFACHSNNAQADQSMIVSKLEGESDAILNFKSIENQPECFSCHNPEEQILGFYLIQIPLGAVSDQISTGIWLTLLIGGIAIVFLTGLLVHGINRLVIKPVDEISKGVVELSSSNLDYEVPVLTQDELGELAGSFNEMRKQMKNTYVKMERREKELAILNEVAFAATQLIDLEESIDSALSTVVNQLNMIGGCIYLFDEVSGFCTLWATHGIHVNQIENNSQCPYPCGKVSKIGIRNDWQVSVRALDNDPRFSGLFENVQDRFVVEVPLFSKNVVLGAMVLVTDINQPINDRTRNLLEVVGREIGVAIDNAMLLSDARRREQEAMTLYELGTKISESLELDTLLFAVAKAARDLLQTDIGMIGLLDERRQEIIIQATAGDTNGTFNGVRLPLSGEAFLSSIKSGKPIIANTFDPDQPIHHDDDLFTEEHIASYLAVPLIHGEHILGLIEVMTRQRRRFLQRDAQLLMRLAHHVVVSIENAQLYEHLRLMATLEERYRLAGEMHDHLAQALGYLNVKATITQELFSSGQSEQTLQSLQELKKAAQITYLDVREAIFNLRTKVSSPKNLSSTLIDYLTEYREYYGVEVNLEAEDNSLVDISPVDANQLLRIIQEALTNVRKHAKASNVWVRIKQNGNQAIISIEDNGRGFDPAQLVAEGRQQFGVKIMSERANSIGGSMEVVSQPGRGTTIIVRIPLKF